MLRLRGGIASLLALAFACYLLGVGGSGPRAADANPPSLVVAAVSSSTTGRAMPSGFLGFSFEYRAMHVYAGRNPDAINPVLLSLIRQLTPGQSPLLRIGGNSTDATWWPEPGVIPPDGVTYGLTRGWLRTAKALATDLHGKLILGVNLEAGRPAIAAEEARALIAGVGRKNIAALEIGNEGDLYPTFVWYTDRLGRQFYGRPTSYTLSDYLGEYSRWRVAIPSFPLAGPAFASTAWMNYLPTFLQFEPHVSYVTFHRYPLRGCETSPDAPTFPSITNLMKDESSNGLAQSVANYALQTHQHGDIFRLDELNSVACTGSFGVSNTFASSLWVLDTLFNLASVGVDGINLHTLPGAAYQPFAFAQHGRTWSANVKPVYYGMLMFAHAFPPGARLLQSTAPAGPVKLWATTTTGGALHVVLINKNPDAPAIVHLSLPGPASALSEQMLTAPSVSSTTGVTLNGQSYAANTTTGAPSGQLKIGTVDPSLGTYTVTVPAGSAMLLAK